MLEALTTGTLIEVTGWALVHSVWQGCLVALIYAAFAGTPIRASAQARHLAACAALAFMLMLPVATALMGHRPASALTSAKSVTESAQMAGEMQDGTLQYAGGSAIALTEARAERGDYIELRSGLQHRAETLVVSLFPWMVACWLMGVLFFALRSTCGWVAIGRLRRSAQPVAEEFERSFSILAERMRVSPAVRLCRSALVEVPTVVGHLRPIVLVPLSALVGLTPRQLEAVLAHELAHIRRYDYFVNLLQTAAETLLFYHPAAWWVSRRARIEREHAADDAAVMAVGDALLYARALATTEALRPSRAQSARLALAANGGSLMRRINRLVSPRATSKARPSFAALAIAMLAPFLCVWTAARVISTPAEAALYPASAHATAKERRVAVTFVNFPGNFQDNRQLVPKTRKLMQRLAAHDIRAVAFVNEMRLYDQSSQPVAERIALLGEWLDAGHELGNETYKHTSLYKVSLAEWRADVERGEQVMRRLMAERGRRLRYFSYPYLNTGADLDEKRAAEDYLRRRGYEIHPVTIDSMDWLFNRAYAEALRAGDDHGAARIRAEYVPYMERMFEFYEGYSREVLGREFPQVLMLTGGPLNADAFDELVAMLKRRAYSFVTMEEAMKDPAYKMTDDYTGSRGDSWIARWAVSKGLPHRDTEEEELPPAMKSFFEEFRRRPQAKNGAK